jgi:predicted kinase
MRCIIMRGLPGAGKSRWISKVVGGRPAVVSADDYFMQGDEYRFDPKKLGDAHRQCMQFFLDAIEEDEEIVIVDNTNTQLWELSPYKAVAEARGYRVEVVEVHASPETCASRNTHGVPLASCQAMASRWEKIPPFWGVTVHSIDNK